MNTNNIEDIYPLSPMQQGMLFHRLAAPESGEYFQQMTWTFQGHLEVPAFEQAWQQIIARHAVLRTDFDWEELEEPAQVVYRNMALTMEHQDWRGLSASQQQERFETFLLADRQRRFDLATAPLLRLTLIQMAEEVYQFLWSYHHILLDGWSMGVILKELLTFYEALSRGRSLSQSGPRPFRDFIAWLQRQDLSKAETFWRQTLKGFAAPTALPIDHSPGTAGLGQMETYEQQQIALTREMTQALQTLARQQQVTFSTLVHGIWGLLLSRYCGEDDVLFGATVSGRPAELPGVETMAGLFINTLPMRVQVRAQDTLGPWLKQLQAQQLERLQYEYSPLVEVQQWSEAPRGQPLFETILVFENYPVDDSLFQRVGDVEIRRIRMLERTNYPLTLEAIPGPELTLRMIYNNRRFDASAITRLLGHFQTLLESAATHPPGQLSELAMLTPEERRQMLVAWNDTKADFPKEKCLHEFFEAQVERTPDAVALIFEDQQLTYRQLNARANQLAHHLQQLGVAPEVLVGICVERSLLMVIGILGILKAGGAYVPLDPAYPKERLDYILKDAQVQVLLTQQLTIDNYQLSIINCQLLCLDRDGETIAAQGSENLENVADAENPAYVIYTSGSTGVPKGVMGLHRNTVNRLAWMWEALPFAPEEVCCQKTSLNFVDSVWEIFGALLKGIPTCIIPEDAVKTPHHLLQTLAEARVTRIVLVPSLLRVILDLPSDQQHLTSNLKIWITSGEAIPNELCQRFMETLPQHVLLNLYGSSEAAADVTWYEASAWNQKLNNVPIGRPIANTQIYLLDANLQPVPIGATGELFAGGDGLARGYLHRPELTAEKFVPNPFGDKSILTGRLNFSNVKTLADYSDRSINISTRLYKTGDLARYLPDGNIEYLGRRDYQVKIRGFRIELGEVEAALAEHPALAETVVLAKSDQSGELGLVAYFVSPQQPAPTSTELRQFLLKKIPDYMAPAFFVKLDAMPLLPNGKIDRRALPAPGRARPELEDGFMAPNTPIEKELAEIWSEVLRIEKIGIANNFFALGGHSLMAMQLLSRLRTRMGVELPVRDFFAAPTIKSLAEKVETTLLAKSSAADLDGMLDFLGGIDEAEAQKLLSLQE